MALSLMVGLLAFGAVVIAALLGSFIDRSADLNDVPKPPHDESYGAQGRT